MRGGKDARARSARALGSAAAAHHRPTPLTALPPSHAGFILETYGFWVLFAAFFPTVLSFLRRTPVLKRALDLPAFKAIINKIAPAGGLPV